MSLKEFFKIGNLADETPDFVILNAELNVTNSIFVNELSLLTAQFFKITQNSKAFYQNVSLNVNIFIPLLKNNKI